jgi:hypothetical protein
MFRRIIHFLLPASLRKFLRTKQKQFHLNPPVGSVDFGDLRRTTPISRTFGYDRGKPIDRYYIDAFLNMNQELIRGQVLEMGEDTYSKNFGKDRVTRVDILNPPNVTGNKIIQTDLTEPVELNPYDCIILTQTLSFLSKPENAIKNLHKALRSTGTLLATFPGISQISRYDMDRWGDYWRFTSLSARHLFEDIFGSSNVTIQTFGNVVTSVSFLHGLAVEDLHKQDLEYHDPDYELLITVKAVKGSV